MLFVINGSKFNLTDSSRPMGQVVPYPLDEANRSNIETWLEGIYPQSATTQEVTDHAEQLIEEGVTINVTGLTEPVYVQGRDKDTRNVQGLVTAASLRLSADDTTTLTVFRDGNNVTHQIVPAQVIEMWQSSAAYVTAVYTASWAIKADATISPDFRSDARWPNPDQTGA